MDGEELERRPARSRVAVQACAGMGGAVLALLGMSDALQGRATTASCAQAPQKNTQTVSCIEFSPASGAAQKHARPQGNTSAKPTKLNLGDAARTRRVWAVAGERAAAMDRRESGRTYVGVTLN